MSNKVEKEKPYTQVELAVIYLAQCIESGNWQDAEKDVLEILNPPKYGIN